MKELEMVNRRSTKGKEGSNKRLRRRRRSARRWLKLLKSRRSRRNTVIMIRVLADFLMAKSTERKSGTRHDRKE